MASPSILQRMRIRATRTWTYLKSLLTNVYFWGGLVVLLLIGLGAYVLVDHAIMPAYTRHEVHIQVPSVLRQPIEEAERILTERDLRVQRIEQQFNPNLPRGVVIDQTPRPDTPVKPGRRIYLTVNTGEIPRVVVPSVEGMSRREAVNQIQAARLKVEDIRPDSIPSPYRNTVTRQDPEPGTRVEEGSSVTLWVSTGLGETYVEVPDVTGLTVHEAREQLLGHKLRSVVVGLDTFEGEGEPLVLRQSREPGTRVREGFEIRLFVSEDGTED